jgi:Holliday junction resolvase YEN1
MFGCQTLIKAHKQGGERFKTHVRVYRASEIRERLDFDIDSVMLFAVLAGGDYDNGLHGCGPQLAKKLARKDAGLARALRRVKVESDLVAWRASLQAALNEHKSQLNVPSTFPPRKALLGYKDPAVSTREQACDLRGLRGGWEKDVNLPRLRTELRHRYKFQTRESLKHIAPILLARALALCNTAEQRNNNLRSQITLKTSRQPSSERRLLFNPLPLLSNVDVSVMPDDEDWSKFEKQGVAYDPLQKVECMVLECLLHNGLPEDALSVAAPAKRRLRSTKLSEKAVTGPDRTRDKYTTTTADHVRSRDSHSPAGSVRVTKKTSPPKRPITSVVEASDMGMPPARRQRHEPNCSYPEEVHSPGPRPKFRRLQLPTFSTPVAHVSPVSPVSPAASLCRPDTVRELRTRWLADLEASSPAADEITQTANFNSPAKLHSQTTSGMSAAGGNPRAVCPIVIDLT